ncbi:MAG: AAA family ATPase [Bacteroidota bacterium]
MDIERIVLKNYKSIYEVELVKPNRFSVFVGPNAAGKSNFFEGLEFFNTLRGAYSAITVSQYGGKAEVIHKNFPDENLYFGIKLVGEQESAIILQIHDDTGIGSDETHSRFFGEKYAKFYSNFSRIFPGKADKDRLRLNDDQKLSFAGGNLEKVLKRLLSDELIKSEIEEWLDVFIPGYDHIEIAWDGISGKGELRFHEQSLMIPIGKSLISDGTFNLLCILAAVYQKNDEPQFLLIEEPENGINPKVQRELVKFFRHQCEEKGHYIWLNTHSQTIVSELTTDEIILVDKVKGETRTKQVKGMNLHGLRMDEALLTNAIGGGIPW